MEETIINNAIALLREVIINGKNGSLQAWYEGEKAVVGQTIQELEWIYEEMVEDEDCYEDSFA